MEDKNNFLEYFIKTILRDTKRNIEILQNNFPLNIYSDTIYISGESALYLCKQNYFKEIKSEKIKDLENCDIEFIAKYPIYSILFKTIQDYGTIRNYKKEKSFDDSVAEIISFDLYFGEDRYIEDPLSHFLLSYIHKQMGILKYTFRIIGLKKDRAYRGLDRFLVKDCIIAEYFFEKHHDFEDCFIFSSLANDSFQEYENQLTIKNIVAQNCISNEEGLVNYDEKTCIDPEKIVTLTLENKSMTTNKKLDYNIKEFEEQFCSFCRDNVSKGFETSCGHFFHINCLEDFLSIYYKELAESYKKGVVHTLEHDLQGNIIRGANYTWCCPNCKSECFKLHLENGIVTNPENCIYKI